MLAACSRLPRTLSAEGIHSCLLQAGAVGLAMLYTGRAFVGVGMALCNQAAPVSGRARRGRVADA